MGDGLSGYYMTSQQQLPECQNVQNEKVLAIREVGTNFLAVWCHKPLRLSNPLSLGRVFG